MVDIRYKLRASRVLTGARKILRNDQLILAVLALIVGAVASVGVIFFREAIDLIQFLAFDADPDDLLSSAKRLPWWQILLVPTAGGLLVGLFIRYAMPGRRPQGVADVMEAVALRAGRITPKTGLGAAVTSALSIGVGASVGREGPAVHLGAAFASWFAAKLHLTRNLSRTVLGCGVASAVAASFNVPISGALFANEVVLGHYALSAFAPIVIASVTGTVVSRIYFDNLPAFQIFEYQIASFLEFPAFIGLGILSGVTAIVLLRGIAFVQDGVGKLPGPTWARPALGGFAVGLIALQFPQVLGVGYEVTNQALHFYLPFKVLALVFLAKVLATALSLGCGFGGGIFSPSLAIGALLGGAYGIAATHVFPELSSGPAVYALIGMGAVAAATLGAPISTTLIVFELTSDYAATMAVMVAVVISSVIMQQGLGKSFFTWQLERRGIDLEKEIEMSLLRTGLVRDIVSTDAVTVTPDISLPEIRNRLQHTAIGELFVIGENGHLIGTVTLADLSDIAFDHDVDDLVRAVDVARLHPPMLGMDDHLETAQTLIRNSGEEHIAVVDSPESGRFVGCVHAHDVMAAFTEALLRRRRSERS